MRIGSSDSIPHSHEQHRRRVLHTSRHGRIRTLFEQAHYTSSSTTSITTGGGGLPGGLILRALLEALLTLLIELLVFGGGGGGFLFSEAETRDFLGDLGGGWGIGERFWLVLRMIALFNLSALFEPRPEGEEAGEERGLAWLWGLRGDLGDFALNCLRGGCCVCASSIMSRT